jgi:flap endonuclease-1
MGIKDLSRVLADHCPNAVKMHDLKSYFGRKIAVDYSTAMYQFLIAIRHDGSQLANADGEVTRFYKDFF